MFTINFKRYFHLFFKYSATLVLVAALTFGGLPLAAHASAVQNPAKAPLLVPGADTTLSIHPLEHVMIGEDFEFYTSFDNSAETGYGPFIDLIFPSNGVDGAAGTDTPDGIDFVSAEYESYTLPAIPLPFPAPDPLIVPTPTTTCVSHPFAVDASGNAVQVCGTPGDTLVVLELPFSSITAAMPMLYVEVTAHVSNLADVDAPLTILGRGGYRYGQDSLNNPVADPAILNPSSTDGSGWPSLQVTPRVIAIEKDFVGPAECPYLQPDEPVLDEMDCPYGNVNPVYESASGPNFPRQYVITVYVAATGNPVTNVDVTDYFPNNLAYLSSTPAPTSAPPVGVASNSAQLVTQFASLASGSTTTITVDFFIPELDGGGNPVLDPATGNSAIADNTATAIGDWTPVDPRDTGGPDNAIANGPLCPGDCVTLNELNIRSIAVQKSVEIETPGDDKSPTGYSPGDKVKYTLDFQISDYFTFDTLVLTDLLTDGQRVDSSTAPSLEINGNTYTLAAASLGAPNYDISCNYSGVPGVECTTSDPATDDGSTTLVFRVSDEIITRGQNGRMIGGCIDATLGGMLPVCTPASPGDGPTTGTITFYATIQEDFSDNYPSGDTSVDHGDKLFNSVIIDGALLDNVTFAPIAGNPHQTNDSAQKIKIVYGDITKTVYAVNGSTSFTAPAEVQPGDTITFRMTQSLPSSDSDKLLLTDYLPLPIFDATTVTTFDDPVADPSVAPVTGHVQYGPSNTLNTALLTVPTAPAPTISTDLTNSLSFDFGSFDDPSDTTSVLDILFTVTVTNEPYADGSILTNLGAGFEDTTDLDQHIYIGNDQFKLKEPGISLRKGVVASDDVAAVFVPSPVGPVTFNAPGSNPSWSGTIASDDNDPSTSFINSDVNNVLSGDLVTFAIVLENLGHSSLGAFDISFTDTKPADMDIPTTPAGLNLQVRRGDGNPIAFTNIGSGLFDPAGGIQITNESPTQGAAHVYDAAPAEAGKNLIVITYDLQIVSLPAATSIVNTATLLSYAGTEGGPNHVGALSTPNVHSDDATATLLNAAPVIDQGSNINVNMSEDASPTPFALALTATDPNNDTLTWSIPSVGQATYGTAAVGASSGIVSYVPFSNYNGTDMFAVQVSDGSLAATINVHVTIKAVLDNMDLIWNQNYKIQYDTWIGSEDINAFAFASGYRKATSGTFTFKPNQKFTSFEWTTYRGPDQGKAQVLVDGAVKATVDLYNATAQWQYPVKIKGLTNGKHTVVVVALNKKNPASSGKWVVVDGFKVGSTTYNDNTINVPYSDLFSYGSWVGKVQKSGPRFGAYRISSVQGASMKFSFTGTQFVWVTARGPLYGKARIYVDGAPLKTVDLYRAGQQWRYRLTINQLTFGPHTIEIRVIHTKNPLSKGFGIVSDGFEID